MRSIRTLAVALLALPLMAHTGRAPARSDDHQDVLNTIADFKKVDPGIDKFFSSSAGYAVFPTIGKGGIGIGGAHGDGELLVGGKALGTTSMTQVTIGLQLGGQAYSEVIFFETEQSLAAFEKSDFAFAAQVSAVALKSGASSNAKYTGGVAVFTLAKGGLMAEASVGGQKFSYKPFKSPAP
jgi:lipid-binding SYLF domain-containing protein